MALVGGPPLPALASLWISLVLHSTPGVSCFISLKVTLPLSCCPSFLGIGMLVTMIGSRWTSLGEPGFPTLSLREIGACRQLQHVESRWRETMCVCKLHLVGPEASSSLRGETGTCRQQQHVESRWRGTMCAC